MSYNPKSDEDFRVVYNAATALFELQQLRIRNANGTTDANDLGSILDLGQEGWETRGVWRTASFALLDLFARTVEEQPIIRSIELGPVPLNAAEINRVRDFLTSVTV